MITKNYDGNLFFKIIKRLFLDSLAGSMFILKFQFKHCWALITAHFTFYGNLGQLLKKRKLIKAARTNSNTTGLYKKSIIYKKYFGGVSKFSQLETKDFQ